MIIIYASENTEKLYLSIENSVRLIKEIKDELRTRDVVKEVCKEYGFTTDIIDGVVIKFDDIETSAETVNGEMVLNNELIKEEFDVLMRYPVHELVHVFQHMRREGTGGDPYEGVEYIDRPDEQEAFIAQIEDEKESRGEEAAEEYVDELLTYHKVPEQEKPEKKEILLGLS
jgi:hypothetical protein